MTRAASRRSSVRGPLTRGDLAGLDVVVLGLGVTGSAVAGVLAEAGANIRVSEARPDPSAAEALRRNGIEVETGAHDLAERWVAECDLVVPSPGIAPHTGPLARALDHGTVVLSEIELASRLARGAIIAVTGTNGKTTVASLVGACLERDRRDVAVCGNIGRPFISALRGDADVYVVEVSSFQLAFCDGFHPHVAVVTNVAPDHLDWHGSFEAYRAVKARVAARMIDGDTFVYPAAQPDLAGLAPPGPRRVPFSVEPLGADGVWVDGTEVVSAHGGVQTRCGPAEGLVARGRPFAEDAAAGVAAALAAGAGAPAVAAALAVFRPDAHRCETVGSWDGVRYVDDSKATNPHAAIAAIRGSDDVVLVAGGRNKGLDLSPLAGEATRIRALVAIGEAAGDLAGVFTGTGVPVHIAGSMTDAVSTARSLARPGDVVLLSPGCASFDMFSDYAARGDAFRRACLDLLEPGRS